MTRLELDPPARRFLGDREVAFNAGDEIIAAGRPPRDFFLLVSGCVTLRLGTKEVRRLEQPGAFFGELALLDRPPRPIAAAAVERTVCYRIPAAELENMVRQSPDLSLRLIQSLANEVVAITNLVRETPAG